MRTTSELNELRAYYSRQFKDQMNIIQDAVAEAREILNKAIEIDLLDEIEAKRAESYWLPNIEGTVDGSACMHSMADTLKAIGSGETE